MTRYGNEKEKMRSLLDPGPVPEIVEMRLREAYAALPERRPARPARPRLRVLRTALAAAALCDRFGVIFPTRITLGWG